MLEDKVLIKKIQQGEIELIELLIEKYYRNIYAFCYRKIGNSNIAYDLTQEVFLRIVQYINTYVDKNNFKSYLFKIAVNVCNDYYRKNRIHMEDIDAINYVAYTNDKIADLETADVVRQALNTLPDIQKDVIILRYYHDMKVREIAKIVGTSLPTAKSRLKQGLDKLKKQLREEDLF